MSLSAIQNRFIEEINHRGFDDDKYIDKNEEREILQIAIHQGIGVESARQALAEVCANQGYVLESDLMKLIEVQCGAAAGNDGKIDRARYEAILDSVRSAAQGRRNDRELARLVLTAIEDFGLKVKSGWPFNWHRSAKREAGMK